MTPKAANKWERAVVEAADCPPDSAESGNEMTLVLRYPDGTLRYVAVEVKGMTNRIRESKRRPL